MEKTYYDILGISHDAEPEIIRASYRALMLKYHPDSSAGDIKKTQNINEAYECLNDVERRKAYDEELDRAGYSKKQESMSNSSSTPTNNNCNSGSSKPVLTWWETNGGMTFLGIVATWVGNIAIRGNHSVVFICCICIHVAIIWYASTVYPSFFTEKPVISNRNAVSFLNGALGGVIFGPLWNSNLTNGKPGISNRVAIVVYAVFIVVEVLLYFSK